ncbi:MAG: flagellar protein FlgN [Halanaerobiales bacterium]|nr:flagellar protein FlgN [Halanaerobiales bacterium]
MNHLNELLRVLAVEQGLYEELAVWAQKKQEVIIANDIDELAKCLKEEQELIEKIETVEKERRQSILGLSTVLNISEKELSFSKIRDFIDERSKEKLEQFRISLLQTLEKLNKTNDTNKMLIEEAMHINDFTIRTLTLATSPSSSTYGRKGVDDKKSQHLIDKRV